jgi:hypothetical protein
MKTSAKENIGGLGRALLALWLLLFPLAAAVSAGVEKTPAGARAPALAPAAPPLRANAPAPGGVWGENRVRGSEPFFVRSRWGEIFVIPDSRRGCVRVWRRDASGRVNLYFYADNDPVNRTDPLGLFSWEGLFGEFEKQDTDGNGRKLLEKALRAGYTLEKGDFTFDDWDVDDTKKIIYINNKIGFGSERSDSNAAAQLLQALDESFDKFGGRAIAWGAGNVGGFAGQAEAMGLWDFENAGTEMEMRARRIGSWFQNGLENEALAFATGYIAGKTIAWTRDFIQLRRASQAAQKARAAQLTQMGLTPEQIQEFEDALDQGADILEDARSKYGRTGVQASISRKTALKRLEGLTPQVEAHLAKIANNPGSQDIVHWQTEIRGWLTQMEHVLHATGQRTSAEWAARIAEWRTKLGQ